MFAAAASLLLAAPLSPAEVATRLRPVPAFVIAASDGRPVIATQPDGKAVVGAFLDFDHADSTRKALEARNQSLKGLKVLPASMGELYLNNRKAAETKTTFVWISPNAEVARALELVRKTQPEAKEFNGAPLYVVETGPGNYLTVTQGTTTVSPCFLSYDDAVALLERAKVQNPQMKTLAVRATSLDGLITALETADSSATKAFQIVPAKAAVEKARSLVAGG